MRPELWFSIFTPGLDEAADGWSSKPATQAAIRVPAHPLADCRTIALVQAAAAQLLQGLGVPQKAVPAAAANGAAAELRIRREIRQDGGMLRSRCFVNGAATSLRVLRELAAAFVDVNGQNSALSLRCLPSTL